MCVQIHLVEYNEVLDKLVDKVLVLDLKRRKNEISTQTPGTKYKKTQSAVLDLCGYGYKHKYNFF